MRFAIQSMVCVMLCVSTVFAQSNNTKNVPTIATEELQRRGPDVEELGTIQAGPEAGVRRAMAPPADDSDKWFVNFVGAGTTSTDQEKAATKLLLDDVKALKFSQYVKPGDTANSWGHWQEYRIDDILQKEWFEEAKPQLKQVGLPAIIIQPPANGKYGPNEALVCVVGQYDGRPQYFSELIRARVEAYIHKNGYDGTAETAKLVPHGQSSTEPIEAKPPFDLPEPIAYPDAKLLPKRTLTFEQIRKKFPLFPPADAAHYADLQLSEQEILDAEKKFETELLEVNKTPANPTPEVSLNPPKAKPSEAGDVTPIVIGTLIVVIAMLGMWIRQLRNPEVGRTVRRNG